MQMRHAAFCLLPPFSILFEFNVHSASVYLGKMSSDESSDSEMPYKYIVWGWGGLGGRGSERRWWQWRRTWIFRSNSTGTWPSRDVSTLFTLVSQWNHDISSYSHQKLQHYSTRTDIYACCFGFQVRTVWPERFHLWNLQKWVDRWDWPLNLVLCFRSSPSVKHGLCSWQLS